jgi:LPP20 lipoprotein
MYKYSKRGMLFLLTAAAFVALFAGCATTSTPSAGSSSASDGDMPAWFLDPASAYPDSQYMTGIGSGDTRRAAEQSAMAGLSQIFESQISVDVNTAERYRDLVSASGSVSESELMLAQSTSVQSNQTLLNVQFGEAAVDSEGRVHVIAYIDRAATGRIYQDLIEKNGRIVSEYLADYRGASDPIRRFAYISAAAVVAQSNALLLDQLRIISEPFYAMTSITYSQREVQQEKVDTASAMTIKIDIAGDDGDRVANAVKEALSDERFPTADPALITIRGEVRMEPIDLNPKYKSVRWYLNLDFIGPDGKALVTYDNQDRASAVTEESARSFAYDDINKAVSQDFIGSVRGYFDGLVMGN